MTQEKQSGQLDVIDTLKTALLQTGLLDEKLIAAAIAGDVTRETIIGELDQRLKDMHPEKNEVKDRYVVGFVFNPEQTHTLLIWKNRPAWQAGKLNGIGGKIEKGETPIVAMIREFEEETGLHTDFDPNDPAETPSWVYVGRRYRDAIYPGQPGSFELFIYVIEMPLHYMKIAKSITDEEIQCLPFNAEILRRQGIPGLAWTADIARCSLNEAFIIDIEDPINLEDDTL